MNENQKAMKIWDTYKTNNMEHRKTLLQEENLHYSEFNVNYKTYNRGSTRAMKIIFSIVWKLSTKNHSRGGETKWLENLKIQTQNLTRKIQHKFTLLERTKIQINKTRTILNNARIKTVVRGFGIRHGDEILWRRIQGKTRTLYTWGRGTQVETIRN